MSLKVKNKLFQPILVNIKGRKEPLKIASRATETIASTEVESSELKSLIASGDLKVVAGGKPKGSGGKK